MKATLILGLVLGLLVACSGDKDDNGEDSDSEQSPSRGSVQPYTAWKVAEVQSLPDRLDRHDVRVVGFALLSPDSSALAWDDIRDATGEVADDRTLCTIVLADTDLRCAMLPESFVRTVTGLAWSGDSQHMFFTEDALVWRAEADIWQFDAATGVATNRTDDQKVGTLGRGDTLELPVALDIAPTWNAARDELYFLRGVWSDDDAVPRTIELFRLNNGQDAERVHDWTEVLPPLTRHADITMAFSPDGKRVAVVTDPLGFLGPEDAGLWVFDLDTGALEYQATMNDLRGEAASEWQGEVLPRFNPTDVVWANDAGVVVFLHNEDYAQALPNLPVYVDIETGVVSRLLDISAYIELRTLIMPDEAGHMARYYFPRQGLISPDGGTFFFLHTENADDDIVVSALPLPPDGRPPVVVSTLPGEGYVIVFQTEQSFDYYRRHLTTINADGWALVGLNLARFEAE